MSSERKAKRLEPPDTHHLRAAEGWLELGNAREATEELNRISTAGHEHPGVLEVRWSIHAHAKEWDACLEIAGSLIERFPQRSSGWIHRSYALHEMKRTQEARACLLPAAAQFPKHAIIAYNLACYACQLGDLEEARRWLRDAMSRGTKAEIRRMAREDPDLAPLREEIDRL